MLAIAVTDITSSSFVVVVPPAVRGQFFRVEVYRPLDQTLTEFDGAQESSAERLVVNSYAPVGKIYVDALPGTSSDGNTLFFVKVTILPGVKRQNRVPFAGTTTIYVESDYVAVRTTARSVGGVIRLPGEHYPVFPYSGIVQYRSREQCSPITNRADFGDGYTQQIPHGLNPMKILYQTTFSGREVLIKELLRWFMNNNTNFWFQFPSSYDNPVRDDGVGYSVLTAGVDEEVGVDGDHRLVLTRSRPSDRFRLCRVVGEIQETYSNAGTNRVDVDLEVVY